MRYIDCDVTDVLFIKGLSELFIFMSVDDLKKLVSDKQLKQMTGSTKLHVTDSLVELIDAIKLKGLPQPIVIYGLLSHLKSTTANAMFKTLALLRAERDTIVVCDNLSLQTMVPVHARSNAIQLSIGDVIRKLADFMTIEHLEKELANGLV